MPDNLDAIQQVIASMLVVVIGGSIAFFGFTKKWLDKLSPAPKPTASDTVLISGAFADTAIITKLNAAIDRLDANVVKQTQVLETIAHNSGEEVSIQRSHTQALDVVAGLLRSLIDRAH